MAAEWYYREMGEEVGPIDARELKRLASEGRINPDTHVRKSSSDWVRAEKVKDLFSRQSSTKTPSHERKSDQYASQLKNEFTKQAIDFSQERQSPVDPNDPRPFCLNCFCHMSPGMAMSETFNTGPTSYIDTGGPVDLITSNQATVTRLLCGNCGQELCNVEYCDKCCERVPVSTQYHRYSGFSWDVAKMDFCLLCENQVSGPQKGPCFIATAAFQNKNVFEVSYLRKWRDEVLFPTLLGRCFIRWYYSISPSIAYILDRSPTMQLAVRCMLRILVIFLKSVNELKSRKT